MDDGQRKDAAATLSRKKLKELVDQIDPKENLDPEVENVIMMEVVDLR